MWLWLGCVIFTFIVAYIVYTLLTTSGSEFPDNSLDAFIKAPATASNVTVEREVVVSRYERSYEGPGRQVLLLYGTEYGFSEEVARKLYDRIADADELWQPRLVNMKDYQAVDFSQEQVSLCVMSTAGDGVAPSDARAFFDELSGDASRFSVKHLRFSVLALGDSNYPHYCRAGRNLHNRLLDLGSTELCYRADVDQEDWSVIHKWMDSVLSALQNVHIDIKSDYLKLPLVSEEGVTRTSPFLATLKVKNNLTTVMEKSDKETVHCEFDITDSGITWTAGDALGIYSRNNPDEINMLLQAMLCDGSEITDVPKWAFSPKPEMVMTLRDVLLTYYDLKHVAVDLLCELSAVIQDADEKDKMTTLLINGITKDNKTLHDYLYAVEVADVLEEFRSAQLSARQILSHLKPLQPRYYSISSSPLIDKDRVCVTAAVVRYSTLGKQRTGVTTTFLQDRLDVGNICPVFISRNPDFRLPDNHDYPVIMIGPGTGIAPFRAFIQERVHLKARGKNRLYFGCRHSRKDFLYKEELETWNKRGCIELRTAFSRDQPHKIYVQDLIKEDASIIWELISQYCAHIYVCGDAKHMAHDVHKALVSMIMDSGQKTASESEQYLLDMEEAKRYQKDVWVT